MQARWTTFLAVAVAAVAIGWMLHVSKPTPEQAKATDARESVGEARERRDAPSPSPAAAEAPPNASDNASPVDVRERARFNERAREFFAQAPTLSPDEARQRADDLSQELSRIEQAGGLSAGETFLIRAGLIRATVADEQQQLAQIRALKERYEADARQRNALASGHSDPMFDLYKVREGQIVAEVMSLATIPGGLTREEYLRRRLQTEREQLLGEAM
ncbi:hypothetical protein JM946_19445 [Steroidobacter sp. S1-65]|uniref:Lipase chaperone n=1 Tax=Steroidobacter gossypii TaxID=2805490 RepID=A0ABS1X111_9GAMM|nr:hypothetical protein [Steroidobacter gossypii]MBM0106916.1 hypothetical protein [Steroidobacter gossypii]